VRELGPSDLTRVQEVQRKAHPSALVEPSEVFARRIYLFPSGALGAFDLNELAAYLFCHPWTLGEAPPLHDAGIVLPNRPTCMYIHDLAVRPQDRSRGLAERLVTEALSIADKMSLPCALVAVGDSEAFWEGRGFVRQHLIDYGPGRSTYMVS
jgi:ribosomal protein S18 acetylase RimI-like enzyme